MPNRRNLRVWARFFTAAVLCATAFLIPSPGAANDPCRFDCWDATYFYNERECIAGPPVNCTYCLLYCLSFEPV